MPLASIPPGRVLVTPCAWEYLSEPGTSKATSPAIVSRARILSAGAAMFPITGSRTPAALAIDG